MAAGRPKIVRNNWAGRAVQVLDSPQGPYGVAAILAIVAAIYISIVALVVEMRWSELAIGYAEAFLAVEIFVLTIFTVEFAIRLLGYRNPVQYLTSWSGLVDFLAIAPSLVGLFLPAGATTMWLRVLRLIRLVRLLKFVSTVQRAGSVFDGVTRRIAPALALAVGAKGIMVATESQGWWPEFGGLTIVIGVAGFAIGILLGTKLGIANRRLYDVEDAICRIVGGLRDIPRDNTEVRSAMQRVATRLYATLSKNHPELFGGVRRATVAMEERFEENGIGGPATATLHRDLEFVLHRIHARTPPAYDDFLRAVTVVYSAVVVVMVPGLLGFFAVLLVVYVLGGMYAVIDDMDHPLDNGHDSLVSIDLSPLDYLLRQGVLSRPPEMTDITISSTAKASRAA